MGFFNKLGLAVGVGTARETSRTLPGQRNSSVGNRGAVAAGATRAPEMQETSRLSNGLKEFLWNLDGLGHGTLLDLGPAWQTTLTFFIERGFRVSSEDILRGWSEFSAEDELRTKDAQTAEDFAQRTPEARAKRFLNYPAASFDALLCGIPSIIWNPPSQKMWSPISPICCARAAWFLPCSTARSPKVSIATVSRTPTRCKSCRASQSAPRRKSIRIAKFRISSADTAP
jgi:hypothetical protein